MDRINKNADEQMKIENNEKTKKWLNWKRMLWSRGRKRLKEEWE